MELAIDDFLFVKLTAGMYLFLCQILLFVLITLHPKAEPAINGSNDLEKLTPPFLRLYIKREREIHPKRMPEPISDLVLIFQS